VGHKQRREPVEYDVFVCGAGAADAGMASIISSYLTRRGFRVFLEDRTRVTGSTDRQPTLIDEIPDFLFLATSSGLEAAADPSSPVHLEVAHALGTARNVIRVSVAGAPPLVAATLPDGLSALAEQQALSYDPDRLAESLSLIQHSLSSDTTVDDRHLMRRTKRWFLFAAIFVFVGYSLQTVPPLIKAWMRSKQLPPVAPFTLYWSGFGQRADNGAWVEFPLAPGSPVSGGDQIRVFFSPSADGFAYVIAKDARGRVTVLFPAETVKGGSRVRAGHTYEAPVESDWLTIDPQAGLDTIYAFGSHDPLQNLEELVEEPETPASISARRDLVDQTIAGLLDGRHYQLGRRLWIRTTQFVDQGLKPAQGPAKFSAALGSGAVATHPPTVQAGLVSTLGEIKVAFRR